jgi:hypothetical protein
MTRIRELRAVPGKSGDIDRKARKQPEMKHKAKFLKIFLQYFTHQSRINKYEREAAILDQMSAC